jgi:hypothetical protein
MSETKKIVGLGYVVPDSRFTITTRFFFEPVDLIVVLAYSELYPTESGGVLPFTMQCLCNLQQ